jgi:hypothetical protein
MACHQGMGDVCQQVRHFAESLTAEDKELLMAAVQGPKSIKVLSLDQLEEEARKHEEQMDRNFEYDARLGYLTIHVAYPYHIELRRIPDLEGLVPWVEHLSGKGWMTADLIREFIRRVCFIKGWKLYRRNL